MIRVYHNRNFLENPNAEFVPLNFIHVADVDIPDKHYEQAFQLTNHIDVSWWHNERVHPQAYDPQDLEPKYRSTSTGDVVELSDGRKFRVQPSGWSEILQEEREWRYSGINNISTWP